MPTTSLPSSAPPTSDLDQAVIQAFEAIPPRRQRLSAADLTPLRQALDAGGSPNGTIGTGHNMLGIAVYRSSQQTTRVVGEVPLHPVVKLLLDHGADPNRAVGVSEPYPALHFAAVGPSLAMLDALLNAGADPSGLGLPRPASPHRAPDPRRSALHVTKRTTHVQRLIEGGADPMARDVSGHTPLHLVTNPDNVALLVAAGADLNARNTSGQTPLHTTNEPSVIRALLDAGADPQALDGDGRTPLESFQNAVEALKAKRLPGQLAVRADEQDRTIMTLLEEAVLRTALVANPQDPSRPRSRL